MWQRSYLDSMMSGIRVESFRRAMPLVAAALFMAPERLLAQGAAEGIVYDSLRGMPLRGALVVATRVRGVDTAFHSAQTDGLGRFLLKELPAGQYTLSVEHAVIDSSGIGPAAAMVSLNSVETVHADLAIPSARSIRRTFCPSSAVDAEHGMLIGTIRGEDLQPVPNAVLYFSWREPELSDRRTISFRQMESTATADGSGVYRACSLPLEQRFLVRSVAGNGARSGLLEETIPKTAVRVLDINLDIPTAAAVQVEGAERGAPFVEGRYSVSGQVRGNDEMPISSARVVVLGTTRSAQVDSAGAFHVRGVAGGSQTVEILALGFVPKRIRVDVRDDLPLLSVHLDRTAVVLDSMRVTASRSTVTSNLFHREFDDRARIGQGVFISQSDIEQRHAIRTSDVLKFVGGLTVADWRATNDVIIMSNRGTGFSSKCVLQVYIDGMQMRPGDLNVVNPASIHGIEVHTVADMPPKYPVDQCGAIFVWTK